MPHDEKSSDLPKRKLTTILAADVVGYSRMMGIDENGTHKLLGKCRKIIDRNIKHHGGRIFNTGGDSVMAEFGSTVEAVRCAIEIQEELVAHNTDKPKSEQMWFRIGLNVGDVIIEGNDLIGDGVNIAARMESIATPGGICISGSVYELVHNKLSFAFEDMGKQSVKNIIEPVSSYSLLPAATPQITPSMAGKLPSGSEKKKLTGLPIVVAVVLVVGLIIAATYFAIQQGKSTPPVSQSSLQKKSMTASPELTRITPSLFVGKTVEGVTRKKGERFVIEVMEHGKANVTIFRRDESQKPRFIDSGRWWINNKERICFQFWKFAASKKMCRIYDFKEDREFLVSGNPTHPKWLLQTQ